MRVVATIALRRGALALLLCGTAAGCASARYVYRPEENATARVSGQPAAYYPIPPEAPRGAVRVANLGITKLEPRGGEGSSLHAMHVRLVVENDGDSAPWQVDTREQIGSIGRYGQSRAAYVAVDVGRPPIVTLASGGRVDVDLFYPLPTDMEKASEIPEFEVLWKVDTPDGAVAQRTTFERVRIEPTAPSAYAGAYWGPGWYGWYDPLWPDYAFWGAPAGPMYYSVPVIQTGPPPPPPAIRVR